MTPEQLAKLRQMAQSILDGVDRLETLDLGPGWSDEAANEHLGWVVRNVTEADRIVWNAIGALAEEYEL